MTPEKLFFYKKKYEHGMTISASVGLVNKRNMTEKLCHSTIKLANVQKSVLYLIYFNLFFFVHRGSEKGFSYKGIRIVVFLPVFNLPK